MLVSNVSPAHSPRQRRNSADALQSWVTVMQYHAGQVKKQTNRAEAFENLIRIATQMCIAYRTGENLKEARESLATVRKTVFNTLFPQTQFTRDQRETIWEEFDKIRSEIYTYIDTRVSMQ